MNIKSTYRFGDGGYGLLSRQNAYIVSVLYQSVVSAASEIGERLSCIDVGDVKQGLGKSGDVSNDVRWVDTFEDVVRKKGSNGDGIVLVLDGFALRDVPWHVGKGLICWRENGDVRSRGKGVCKAIHKTNKPK